MTQSKTSPTPPLPRSGDDRRAIDPAAVGQVPGPARDIELTDGDLKDIAGAARTCEQFTPGSN